MNTINELLKETKMELHEFIQLMEYLKLSEAERDAAKAGEEISRGKNPLEKSSDEKEKAGIKDLPPEEEEEGQPSPPQPGEPAAPEGAEAGAAPPPPGSNISIGKKVVDDGKIEKEAPVKISGKKEKVNLKPHVNMNDRDTGLNGTK